MNQPAPSVPPATDSVRNPKRRSFLLVGLTGAGAFIFGRLFGDDLLRLFGHGEEEVVSRHQIGGFSIVEKRDEMIFTDPNGEEVFVVDTASFRR